MERANEGVWRWLVLLFRDTRLLPSHWNRGKTSAEKPRDAVYYVTTQFCVDSGKETGNTTH